MLEVGDFLLGKLTGPDELVHERVIGRRREQRPVAQNVAAAVADPGEVRAVFSHEDAHESRRHPLLAACVVLGHLANAAVRPLHRDLE